jgi:hypothetical protein
VKLHNLILDDFLDDLARWRSWLDGATFHDVVSDVDGVTYPNICNWLPGPLHQEIVNKLRSVAGLKKLNWLFARMSPSGVHAPHFAHHDASMGAWSLMLYMNRVEHCDGGTAILRHKDGQADDATWARDTNDLTRWHMESMCPMVPNRAFIFQAGLWHGALPIGGFGSTQADARLVITAFFE